jgi:hypothetical protein
MAQLLKWVGFWPPFMYGAVVFSLFWMLDRQAAPQARKVISNWFAGAKYDKADAAAVILYVFDGLYTHPLWRPSAIFRSLLISVAATILISLQIYPMIRTFFIASPEVRLLFTTQTFANVFADYISLFFIRRWLILGGTRPLFALSTAPIIGVFIVAVCYDIRDVIDFSLTTGTFHLRYFLEDFDDWLVFLSHRGTRRAFLIPALVVHLWLPLFAFGIVVAKFLNSVRAAGRFSQWFFVQGQEHPLRSIGYIAGAMTFVMVAIGMALLR